MNRSRNLLPIAVLFGCVLRAQANPPPVDPPPWWGVLDNDTVSVAWNFNAPQSQPIGNILPSFQVAPQNSWFTGTTLTASGNVAWLPALNGHQGVLAFTGPGNATLSFNVDNDARPNWNKVFWFQFDGETAATSTLAASIRQELNKYKRADVTQTDVPLGNGWTRTTIDAMLIPQPPDEDLDFGLSDTANGTVGIDNLFVNSRCIKPWRDDTGDADGMPTGAPIDLGVTTGNPDCMGVAATEDAAGTRRIWVSGRSQGATTPHQLFQLSATGQVQAFFPQPISTSTTGMTDLTVVPTPNGNLIFGIAQQAAAAQPPLLMAFNETTGTFIGPGLPVAISGSVPVVGITHFPDGRLGAGSLILTNAAGQIFEIDFNGALLRGPLNIQALANLNVTGAGYDAASGMFYFFARGGSPADPRNIQVVGFEVSAYDFQATGVQFYGHLGVPALPGISGPGGIAQGMEVVRLVNSTTTRPGEMRTICIARGGGGTPNGTSYLYELKGPFRYGHSLLGRIGMRGGVPFRGNQNFGITLQGVPHATLATLNLSFNNTTWLNTPLPVRLGTLPSVNPLMLETVINQSLDLPVITLPVVNGTVGHTVPVPPNAIFAYTPTFWQWTVFDPTVPFGLTLSQGGKTVLY